MTTIDSSMSRLASAAACEASFGICGSPVRNGFSWTPGDARLPSLRFQALALDDRTVLREFGQDERPGRAAVAIYRRKPPALCLFAVTRILQRLVAGPLEVGFHRLRESLRRGEDGPYRR